MPNPASDKPLSKMELYAKIAATTELSKKQVESVFDAFKDEIKQAISASGPGVIQLPGLIKIVRVVKPATKERMVKRPGSNEMVLAAAKPEKIVPKARILKALKDMVAQ